MRRRLSPLGILSLFAAAALLLAACGDNKVTLAAPATTPASQSAASNPSCIASAKAIASVGKTVTICGPVVEASYQSGSRGKPTFLNFDKAYPNHDFVVVIWTENRSKFTPAPEVQFAKKNVCATGLVEMYAGKAEIQVADPSKITVC